MNLCKFSTILILLFTFCYCMHSKILFVFLSFYSALLVRLYFHFTPLFFIPLASFFSLFSLGFIFLSLEILTGHFRNVSSISNVILEKKKRNDNLSAQGYIWKSSYMSPQQCFFTILRFLNMYLWVGKNKNFWKLSLSSV